MQKSKRTTNFRDTELVETDIRGNGRSHRLFD